MTDRLREIKERMAPSTIEPTCARLLADCTGVANGSPYLCGACFACRASHLLRLDIPWMLDTIERQGKALIAVEAAEATDTMVDALWMKRTGRAEGPQTPHARELVRENIQATLDDYAEIRAIFGWNATKGDQPK